MVRMSSTWQVNYFHKKHQHQQCTPNSISMSWCKKDITPLLKQWSYVFRALTYWYDLMPVFATRFAACIGCNTMGALVCMCRMYRSVHQDVPSVFICIGMGARTCDGHIPNVPTQTYWHIRDKMAVVAVSLATIPDSLATFLFVNTYIWVWRY